jgi:hypothetical protein
MVQSQSAQIISLSGNPVFQHGAPAPWRPAGGESSLSQITDHVQANLGDIETVFHEAVSDTVRVDLALVKPSRAYPWRRLVTSGMSDLPMAVPEEGLPRHTELVITLPQDWPLSPEALEEEQWRWPVRLAKHLARFPHKYDAWLGTGHTIDHGAPPAPYADSTLLCGSMLFPSVLAPRSFHALPVSSGKTIHFLSVIPLYAEEIRLKMLRGSSVLLDRLHAAGIFDVVAPNRPNVALKAVGEA